MTIASHVCDGADLDSTDVEQIVLGVVLDAVLDGLKNRQLLLGLVLGEEPSDSASIHPHFLGASTDALQPDQPLSGSPIMLHPQPGQAIASVCQRLFDALQEEIGFYCALATDRETFIKRYIDR